MSLDQELALYRLKIPTETFILPQNQRNSMSFFLIPYIDTKQPFFKTSKISNSKTRLNLAFTIHDGSILQFFHADQFWLLIEFSFTFL